MLIYDLNVLMNILKCFNVKDILITSLNDVHLVNKILDYDASIFAFDSKNESDFNQDNLEIIPDNPLDILPKFENYDAIFINDDSNWYTVYNELNIIKECNDEFPLVFICNNRFPNKRRDSYMDPDKIPNEFKHDFVKNIPVYYNNQEIIISDGNYHACEENTYKNGVLTAIEDFLNENNNIRIMNIMFTEEIIILYPNSSINESRLDLLNEEIDGCELEDMNFSDKIIENKFLFNFIAEYNLSQQDLETVDSFKLEILQKNNIIEDYENKFQIHDKELNYKENQIDNVKSKLSLKDSQINNFKSKLFNKENEINSLQNKVQSANKDIVFLKNEIANKDDELKGHQEELQDKNELIRRNQEELQDKNELIRRNQEELQDKNELIRRNQEELQDKNELIKHNQKELQLSRQNQNYLKQQQLNKLSEINSNKYCISCFKEEISNNHLEIEYLKKDSLIKKLVSPFGYFILVLKSDPKEISINLKLYKALKNSKCFDIGYYLNNNKDIQNSTWCKYFSPELHYVCTGFNEKRKFNKKYFNRSSKEELLQYILNCS